MIDPLAEVVGLLSPRASFSKRVGAVGPWHVRREEDGRPFYALVLDGTCRLTVDGSETLTLAAADFVLIPAAGAFTMSSLDDARVESVPVLLASGDYRVGPVDVPPDVRLLIGYCAFGSPDAALLVSLLPRVVRVRGDARLRALVELVREESVNERPAREVVLARLLEVLLIEALRSSAGTTASPGLVRALADDRLASAVRRMHEEPRRPWTVAHLAHEAALSRSAFFARFTAAVGITPMAYLLAWRMALAKGYLRAGGSVGDVAERVGYSSASTFSVAFGRHVGQSPGRYARDAGRTANREFIATSRSVEAGHVALVH